jgi:hypothetical protein
MNLKFKCYIKLNQMSESDQIIEEQENSWMAWINDNTERLKLAGYVTLGVSIASVGGYFIYKHYSNDE